MVQHHDAQVHVPFDLKLTARAGRVNGERGEEDLGNTFNNKDFKK